MNAIAWLKNWWMWTCIDCAQLRRIIMRSQYGDTNYGDDLKAQEAYARARRIEVIAMGAPLVHHGQCYHWDWENG